METSHNGNASPSNTPNVLYAIGVPKAVTAAHLSAAASLCGTVQCTIITHLSNKRKKTWSLEFEDATKGVFILLSMC
jgi:hypothetical protein